MVAIHPGLVLLPTIENTVFQESCYKKYAFVSLCSRSFKIVFISLTKVVVLDMRVIIVQVGILRFDRSIRIISRTCRVVSGLLNIGLNKLFKQNIR